MRTTVSDTLIVTQLLRLLCVPVVWLRGWRKSGPLPDVKKCIIVVAPHTSNWDFPIGISFVLWFRIKAFWLGKVQLFRWPFGAMFRWFGGIAVDRSKKNDLVKQVADLFAANDKLWIAVTPEGTRSRVEKWKTGFYYMALEAKVPLALAHIDYGKKTVGIDRLMEPSGDLEKDLAEIQAYYAEIRGARQDKWGQGKDSGQV